LLPLLFEGQTKAVIELASIRSFTSTNLIFLEQVTQSIGVVLNTIEATMRTEGLLEQSQQLTVELQARQTELQGTNEELASKARLLAEQNAEVERKNSESNRPAGPWKKRLPSWRSRPSTNRNFWPTCRMSCGPRSIRFSFEPATGR